MFEFYIFISLLMSMFYIGRTRMFLLPFIKGFFWPWTFFVTARQLYWSIKYEQYMDRRIAEAEQYMADNPHEFYADAHMGTNKQTEEKHNA